MGRRVFLVVLDSVGIGALPDADLYGDAGSNTLAAAATSAGFSMPNMERLGLFEIEGAKQLKTGNGTPEGAYGRAKEASKGKDTTIGHWEIAGIISERPLPTFPGGFPQELLIEFSERTGRKVLCNKPYSGTEVIRDYGKEHMETGALIVYTSADSVFQIAAHEAVVPVEELYRYCEIARELCRGIYGVGRVIARPFEGEYPFVRTPRRHDYSLVPPERTMLNILADSGYDVIGVGKINDIFDGQGINKNIKASSNQEAINKLTDIMDKKFTGLCMVNLSDFDSIYGHARDVEGYAHAIEELDVDIPIILNKLELDDLLIITADHGNDPTFKGNDHTRENVPVIIYSRNFKEPKRLKAFETFANIGATIAENFEIQKPEIGESILEELK